MADNNKNLNLQTAGQLLQALQQSGATAAQARNVVNIASNSTLPASNKDQTLATVPTNYIKKNLNNRTATVPQPVAQPVATTAAQYFDPETSAALTGTNLAAKMPDIKLPDLSHALPTDPSMNEALVGTDYYQDTLQPSDIGAIRGLERTAANTADAYNMKQAAQAQLWGQEQQGQFNPILTPEEYGARMGTNQEAPQYSNTYSGLLTQALMGSKADKTGAEEQAVKDRINSLMERTSWNDKREQEYQTYLKDRTEYEQTIAEVSAQITHMLPNILISVLGTTAATAATGNPIIGQAVGNAAGKLALGVTAAGGAAKSAWQKYNAAGIPITPQQAWDIGVRHSVVEVGTESMFGGIAGLGEGLADTVLLDAVNAFANSNYGKVLKTLEKSAGGKLTKAAFDTIGENIEEAVSDWFDQRIDNEVLGIQGEVPTVWEALEGQIPFKSKEGTITLLTSLILGASNYVKAFNNDGTLNMEAVKATLADGIERAQAAEQAQAQEQQTQAQAQAVPVDPEQAQREAVQAANPDATVLTPRATEVLERKQQLGFHGKNLGAWSEYQGSLLDKVFSGEELTAKELRDLDLNDPAVREIFIRDSGIDMTGRQIKSEQKAELVAQTQEQVRQVKANQAELASTAEQVAQVEAQQNQERAEAELAQQVVRNRNQHMDLTNATEQSVLFKIAQQSGVENIPTVQEFADSLTQEQLDSIIERWQAINPGKTITDQQLGMLIANAWGIKLESMGLTPIEISDLSAVSPLTIGENRGSSGNTNNFGGVTNGEIGRTGEGAAVGSEGGVQISSQSIGERGNDTRGSGAELQTGRPVPGERAGSQENNGSDLRQSGGGAGAQEAASDNGEVLSKHLRTEDIEMSQRELGKEKRRAQKQAQETLVIVRKVAPELAERIDAGETVTLPDSVVLKDRVLRRAKNKAVNRARTLLGAEVAAKVARGMHFVYGNLANAEGITIADNVGEKDAGLHRPRTFETFVRVDANGLAADTAAAHENFHLLNDQSNGALLYIITERVRDQLGWTQDTFFDIGKLYALKSRINGAAVDVCLSEALEEFFADATMGVGPLDVSKTQMGSMRYESLPSPTDVTDLVRGIIEDPATYNLIAQMTAIGTDEFGDDVYNSPDINDLFNAGEVGSINEELYNDAHGKKTNWSKMDEQADDILGEPPEWMKRLSYDEGDHIDAGVADITGARMDDSMYADYGDSNEQFMTVENGDTRQMIRELTDNLTSTINSETAPIRVTTDTASSLSGEQLDRANRVISAAFRVYAENNEGRASNLAKLWSDFLLEFLDVIDSQELPEYYKTRAEEILQTTWEGNFNELADEQARVERKVEQEKEDAQKKAEEQKPIKALRQKFRDAVAAANTAVKSTTRKRNAQKARQLYQQLVELGAKPQRDIDEYLTGPEETQKKNTNAAFKPKNKKAEAAPSTVETTEAAQTEEAKTEEVKAEPEKPKPAKPLPYATIDTESENPTAKSDKAATRKFGKMYPRAGETGYSGRQYTPAQAFSLMSISQTQLDTILDAFTDDKVPLDQTGLSDLQKRALIACELAKDGYVDRVSLADAYTWKADNIELDLTPKGTRAEKPASKNSEIVTTKAEAEPEKPKFKLTPPKPRQSIIDSHGNYVGVSGNVYNGKQRPLLSKLAAAIGDESNIGDGELISLDAIENLDPADAAQMFVVGLANKDNTIPRYVATDAFAYKRGESGSVQAQTTETQTAPEQQEAKTEPKKRGPKKKQPKAEATTQTQTEAKTETETETETKTEAKTETETKAKTKPKKSPFKISGFTGESGREYSGDQVAALRSVSRTAENKAINSGEDVVSMDDIGIKPEHQERLIEVGLANEDGTIETAILADDIARRNEVKARQKPAEPETVEAETEGTEAEATETPATGIDTSGMDDATRAAVEQLIESQLQLQRANQELLSRIEETEKRLSSAEQTEEEQAPAQTEKPKQKKANPEKKTAPEPTKPKKHNSEKPLIKQPTSKATQKEMERQARVEAPLAKEDEVHINKTIEQARNRAKAAEKAQTAAEHEANVEAKRATAHGNGRNETVRTPEGKRAFPINEQGAANAKEYQHRGPTPVEVETFDGHLNEKYISSVINAGVIPERILRALMPLIRNGQFSYDARYTDKAAIARAEAELKRDGWTATAAKWNAAMDEGRMSKDIATMGQVLLNNAASSGDVLTAMDIISRMVRGSHSVGQSLQAFNIINKLTPDGRLYMVMKSIDTMQRELTKRFKDNAPNLQINNDLMKAYYEALLSGDEARIKETWDALADDIARQIPGTWKEKFNNWRYLAMLGNPRTHIRNIAGNLGFMPIWLTKDALATGMEILSGTKNRTKAFLGFGANDRNLLKAGWSNYDNVVDLIQSGGKWSDEVQDDIGRRRQIYKGKLLEAVRHGNTYMLDKEDTWFSRPAYAVALAGYLKANGVRAESIESGNVDAELMAKAQAYAIKEAQKATYRDSNAFSDFMSKVGRYKGDNVFGKVGSTAMEALLPFRRTPANIVARAFEYSPAGLVKALTADLSKLSKGDITAAEYMDNLASGMTGTGLFALGAYMAAQALVGASKGDDEKKDDFKKMQGQQNYAINIPGGKSVTLDWLAPEALPFFVGVEAFNAYKDSRQGEDGGTLQDFFNAMSGLADPILETSMLSSLQNVLKGIGYENGKEISSIAGNVAINYLSQFFPTILGQFERVAEDKRYETYRYAQSDILDTTGQHNLGNLMNKVPGAEYNQIEYVDAWGRSQATGSVGERVINNLFNPAYVNNGRYTEVDNELERLYDEGYTGVLPTRLKQSAKITLYDANGKSLGAERLTGAEYVRYNKTRGKTQFNLVSEFLSSKAYQQMSDTERAQVISDIYTYATAVANQEFAEGRGQHSNPDAWVRNAMAHKNGTPLQYIEFSAAARQYDGNQTASYIHAANSIGLTDKQADALLVNNYLGDTAGKEYLAARSLGVSGLDYAQYLNNRDIDGNGSPNTVEKVEAAFTQGFDQRTADAIVATQLNEAKGMAYLRARSVGLVPAEYLEFLKHADENENGRYSQDEVRAALDQYIRTGDVQAIRSAIWNGYGWKKGY